MAERTRGLSVDRDAATRSWRERGFWCGLWVDPPGQVWVDYVHDVDEARDGRRRRRRVRDGNAHWPAPGEELPIPARTGHTVRNLGRGESRWLYGYRR